MASKTGINTNVVLKEGSTHGTAVQGVAGDKLPVEDLNTDKNKSALTSNNIGTGNAMETDVEFGSIDHLVNLTAHVGYDNNIPTLIGTFMGAASAPAEQNGGEGDYLHRLTYDKDALKFATIARETSTTTVTEYPSCYPSNLNFSQSRDQYLTVSSTLIADTEVTSSTTNTNASMASATITDTRKVVGRVTDNVLVNAESGAGLAAGTDDICASAFNISFGDPKEALKCFRGASSDGAPIRSSLLNASITLEFLQMEDHTWKDWRDNETKLKMLCEIEGAQIGAGDNYKFAIFIPRMVVINDPNPLNSAGVNGFTVECMALEASSNPSGMDDTLPYIEIINTNSAQIVS